MKQKNLKKIKNYLSEIERYISNGYYSNLTEDKVNTFKEIYKDETGSDEYNKNINCTKCKLNLVKDIYNLINKKK